MTETTFVKKVLSGFSSRDTDPLDRHDFFRTLVQNGSDAILTIDEDSEIIFANQSAERVFGYAPDELVGEHLSMIIPERFQEAHDTSMARYLRTDHKKLDWTDIELPGRHRDGHEVPLLITFEEHDYGDKRVFSGIIRDITERKRRERELERQNERLERFAGIVSHDLRNPLNAAGAQVTLARHENGESVYLDELDELHDRMGELVADVLTLTKEGRTVGEKSEVDLETAARKAWAAAGIESATLDVGASTTIEADEERLRTLLENLIGNAISHVGDDVTVTIGAHENGRGFFVADDGPGIPAEKREEVFEYGHTSSPSGTGFGLSIVEGIADAHEWSVELGESSTGGARFAFDTTTGTNGGRT